MGLIGFPELIMLAAIFVVLWLTVLKGRRQQQQQQQQIVVQNGYDSKKEKMRICPKCGWQNEREAKFCSDCGSGFNVKKE